MQRLDLRQFKMLPPRRKNPVSNEMNKIAQARRLGLLHESYSDLACSLFPEAPSLHETEAKEKRRAFIIHMINVACDHRLKDSMYQYERDLLIQLKEYA